MKFERQQWTGIVEKLTTVAVEQRQPRRRRVRQHPGPGLRGRRRAAATSPTRRPTLGGDDLLQSLVEAGTYDGKFYGVPYYAGARIVLYRKDLFEQVGHRGADHARRVARRRRAS